MKLERKKLLVTGSATGMGAASVLAFAREGASVVGFYRGRGVEAITERLGDLAQNVSFIRCDVSDKDAVFDATARAVNMMGGLDGVVHAAAIAPTTAPQDISFEQLEQVLRINVGGTMLVNQAAFAHLRERGGRIVNFASSTGSTGSAIKADYAASKGAVLAWTRSVATAWGRYGITVNCICPVISTEMYQATREDMTPEDLARLDASLASTIPLGGEFGDPERDFAPVVVFLAGDGSRFITGQTISVDGGLLMVR
ncbi:SDR family NAD(P)-dependent oxidoreductase [Pacificimonas sp. ICDLI1SI03]